MLQDDRRLGLDAVAPRPLAELLACPATIQANLGAATERRNFEAGQAIFQQGEASRGLYLLLAGDFHRFSMRLGQKILLQPLHPGDLVELSAVLGDGHHTYTLIAHSPVSALVLPISALNLAFQQHPPLRMKLLEELGREVARAYTTLTLNRGMKARRVRNAQNGSNTSNDTQNGLGGSTNLRSVSFSRYC
jgi:CRP-like cAMP-binding protein